MNNYFCPLGLLHDRPAVNYVSGNGVLYTGEYFVNGGPVFQQEIQIIRSLFYFNENNITVRTFRYRHDTRIDSLDNIIGFRLFRINLRLKETGWYFNGIKGSNYSWFTWLVHFLKVAWKTRNLKGSEKRNYWWKNGYYGVHKTSSMVLPQYRYFFGEYTWYYKLMFLIHCYIMSKSNNTSAKKLCINMMEFVSMEKLMNKWFDKVQVFSDYFPDDHPTLELVRTL